MRKAETIRMMENIDKRNSKKPRSSKYGKYSKDAAIRTNSRTIRATGMREIQDKGEKELGRFQWQSNAGTPWIISRSPQSTIDSNKLITEQKELSSIVTIKSTLLEDKSLVLVPAGGQNFRLFRSSGQEDFPKRKQQQTHSCQQSFSADRNFCQYRNGVWKGTRSPPDPSSTR